jgi:serine/threonine protein kinase
VGLEKETTASPRNQVAEASIVPKHRALSPEFYASYILKSFLGSGAQGIVMIAQVIETGKEAAVKILKQRSGAVSQEVKVMKRLNHPSIIGIIEYLKADECSILISELHGTEWNLANEKLSSQRNPGLLLVKGKAGIFTSVFPLTA